MIRNGRKNGQQTIADHDPIMNIGNPDAARAEVCRWYYVVNPPSGYALGNGAEFDWPGPEYETIEPERDARHYHNIRKIYGGKIET